MIAVGELSGGDVVRVVGYRIIKPRVSADNMREFLGFCRFLRRRGVWDEYWSAFRSFGLPVQAGVFTRDSWFWVTDAFDWRAVEPYYSIKWKRVCKEWRAEVFGGFGF